MSDEQAHVLIVDDNATNRFLLYRGVQQLGHAASVAEGGQQALEIVKDGTVDAILLDILMPEMTGFEVLERLKQDTNLRGIPVIVISAESDMESIAHSIELGAEDFLPKPFNPVVLRARLNASLEKKRYRDLERAYLDQELMLRQSERIAALARLSAGMAHELHNSVSAAQRSADQIPTLVSQMQTAIEPTASLPGNGSPLANLDQRARELAGQPLEIDPLELSDREQEIRTMLTDLGIDRAWDHAVRLAGVGLTTDDLQEITDGHERNIAACLVVWLSHAATLYSVVSDIDQSLGRISGIVDALKAYSYMDQAPYQPIDIHEALNNTITVLQATIPEGVVVTCQFADELPVVEGYGSELSMVWTNILSNAVDAMGGQGEITIRTSCEDGWVVVEFHDTGEGVPPDIQSRIFDPFFTTKPPGQGAGLGLSVSHSVVVQKHHGQISVHSQPGRTCFAVRLPTSAPA